MIILKTFIMIILHHVTTDNELLPKLLKGYSISTKKRC